jgi:hypothetical protein
MLGIGSGFEKLEPVGWKTGDPLIGKLDTYNPSLDPNPCRVDL